MSSYRGHSSPRLTPFQSAQPQGSIFGGPSSQDALEPGQNTILERDEGEEEGEDDFDRLFDNDVSDDATYRGSTDEDEDGEENEQENEKHSGGDVNKQQRTTPKRADSGGRIQWKTVSTDEYENGLSDGRVKWWDVAMDRNNNDFNDRMKRSTVSMDRSENDFSDILETMEEQYSLPSSPENRPNKFRGHASTWRRLTAGDREQAEHFETLRSRNLAAHLYNAFALRARATKIIESDADIQQRQEAEASLPSRLWTAWPMHPSEVPRADEYLRLHEGDGWFRALPDLRPSAELEEEIISFMLKTAKERFNARESIAFNDYKGDAKDSNEGAATSDVEVVKSEPEDIDGANYQAELRPVVQADDDKSRRQLRPLTRNILTRFDNLLMGLHHGRQGTRNGEDSSASEWQSDSESDISTPNKARGRKRSMSTTRASSKETRHKRARSSVEATSATESSDSSPTRETTDKKRVTSYSRLGLRDWSDVMGIASIQGWPSEVVMRAAQRCSRLFGEDMAFQTLKEGAVRLAEDEEGTYWQWVENETELAQEAEEREQALHSCPPPRYGRGRVVHYKKKKPGRTTKKESEAPQSSRHPPAADIFVPEIYVPELPAPKPSASEEPMPVRPRLKGKGEHRKQDLICPYPSCPRHREGFSRTWNLNLHIKRSHAGNSLYQPK